MAPGPVLFALDPPPASSGHLLLLILADASAKPGQSLLTAWCGAVPAQSRLSGSVACVPLCILCGSPHFGASPREGANVCSWPRAGLTTLWMGGCVPTTRPHGECQLAQVIWAVEGVARAGDGKTGAGPQQLTSWASGGRCPEASRGLACPWGTCPPTAPGGPEEEGRARSPRDSTSALLPLPTFVLSGPISSISILGWQECL